MGNVQGSLEAIGDGAENRAQDGGGFTGLDSDCEVNESEKQKVSTVLYYDNLSCVGRSVKTTMETLGMYACKELGAYAVPRLRQGHVHMRY